MQTSHIGTSDVIFCYNGRDGVITDYNGLAYMRARYYSPNMRRFINADIIAGEISKAVTLNRYAYANGNPVSYIDPFGLSAERGEKEYGGLTLEQCELFLAILNTLFTISTQNEFKEINIDAGYFEYYLDWYTALGEGLIDIDKLLEGQIEISQSFDFYQGKFEQKFTYGTAWGLEYVANIDDYNSISSSMMVV